MSLHWTEEQYQHYLRRGQPPPISEAIWQGTIMRLLKQADYMAYHTFDSRKSPSGWPDVAAIKPTGGLLYMAELKTDTGQVPPAQQAWLQALGQCTGVVAEVWRPSAMEEIIERLRG